MVAVWDFTSFWQFDILFCLVHDNHASVMSVSIMSIKKINKANKDDKSDFVLLSLFRPMLPSVGGFAVSSDGYFHAGFSSSSNL